MHSFAHRGRHVGVAAVGWALALLTGWATPEAHAQQPAASSPAGSVSSPGSLGATPDPATASSMAPR